MAMQRGSEEQPAASGAQWPTRNSQGVYKIIDGLFISGIEGATEVHTLREQGVTHILNLVGPSVYDHPLAGGRQNSYFPNHFKYKILETEDSQEQDLKKHFSETSQFIHEGRKAGGVLVHCYAGVSRSATVLLAYLMEASGLDLATAFKVLLRGRPQAYPNRNFQMQLVAYEDELRSRAAPAQQQLPNQFQQMAGQEDPNRGLAAAFSAAIPNPSQVGPQGSQAPFNSAASSFFPGGPGHAKAPFTGASPRLAPQQASHPPPNYNLPIHGAMDESQQSSRAFPAMPPMPKDGAGMPGMLAGGQNSAFPGGAGGSGPGHGLPGLEGPLAMLENLLQNLHGTGSGQADNTQALSMASPRMQNRGVRSNLDMQFNAAASGPGSAGVPLMPDMGALMGSMGMGQPPSFAGSGAGPGTLRRGGNPLDAWNGQGQAAADARMRMMGGLGGASMADLGAMQQMGGGGGGLASPGMPGMPGIMPMMSPGMGVRHRIFA